jgi:hypothetical protein
LSGYSVMNAAGGSSGVQDVTIRVPSTYISQQASTLDVTLVRTMGSGHGHVKDPLTVDFSAALGSLPGGVQTTPDSAGHRFTPVDESVTFPAGQTTETVVVPIKSGAPNPGLVPILLAVMPPTHKLAGSNTTVYLVSGPDAIPPSIISVHMVKRGIAVTFSKPMAPATVENVHNYAVVYAPSKKFGLADLTGIGLIQTINNTSQTITLKRAIYDPATNTVRLIPRVSLPSSGTYQISSPSSLSSRRANPHKAQPLTDLQGNVLSSSGTVGGAFSISISRGHPYRSNSGMASSFR